MYWKIEDVEFNGITYLKYKFFKLVLKSSFAAPYYNAMTKEIQFPVKYELMVEERLVKSEEDFLKWYQEHVKL